jgi:hypothetical protein
MNKGMDEWMDGCLDIPICKGSLVPLKFPRMRVTYCSLVVDITMAVL